MAETPPGWKKSWRPPKPRGEAAEKSAAAQAAKEEARARPAPIDAVEIDHEEGLRLTRFQKDALAGLVPRAVARLAAELNGDFGAELAHDSAKYVMDQVIGKAMQANLVKAETEVTAGEALLQAIAAAERAQTEHADILRTQVMELPQ